jgi:hypothetical protein
MPLVRIDVVEGRRTPEQPTGDLVVSVMGSTRADWSFGLGRAQFLEGAL